MMNTQKAREMGKAAFLRGIILAPSMDVEFMQRFPMGPVGSNTDLLVAWGKGWTEENLKADVDAEQVINRIPEHHIY